jgi:hypothetical protein
MRLSLSHHGIPVGTVDVTIENGRAGGLVSVLPAYQAIRALVQRATQAVADVRENSKSARRDRRERFREAATLTRELALHDEAGHSVVADYIVLHDEADTASPMLTAIGIRFPVHA